MNVEEAQPRWEHFEHGADIGIRGFGATLEQAFEQAALAMTSVITELDNVEPSMAVAIACEASDDEVLFLSWINELVYQMAVQHVVFRGYRVSLQNHRLLATAYGEKVDQAKHQPAVEVKGATFTELRVYRQTSGSWVAQCVVDV